MANIRVSAQAFLQEVQNWTVTLNRQTQKLNALKTKVKNKFKLNSIDIVLTEIQSLQIKYKKIKKKYFPFLSNENIIHNLQSQNQKSISNDLLNQYSQLSKIFMQILQKVSLIEGQKDQPNFLIENFQGGDQSRKKSQSLLNQNEKTFLNDTFAFKVSKERRDKNNKSIFEKRRTNMQKQSLKENSCRVKTHSMITKITDISNITTKNQPTNKKQKTNLKQLKPQINEESSNLWQIRHQLQTITQMMKEMKSQIQFHQHQETNREINKIQTKNRKMASDLKSIKEENRLILDKIEDMKKQLMEEKKTQVDLINRFQKRTGNSKYNLYDSIATHADNYMSVQGDKSYQSNRKSQNLQNVSDWVRMRI